MRAMLLMFQMTKLKSTLCPQLLTFLLFSHQTWQLTPSLLSHSESYQAGHPVILYGLLPHEQKISVVNFLVKRCPGNNEPIKSKERLIFHVGYKRFSACPIFSQHTNGNKHKVWHEIGIYDSKTTTIFLGMLAYLNIPVAEMFKLIWILNL